MFRSKKDIDRHVSDLFSKIHNENERNLRGFNIARLYFQFKDYETARKYLQNFLSVRDSHPPSYKLMAQIHEACGNIEGALYSYKRSLELDANQRDIVLKICELYCQIPVDHETARYWADRADQLFPHNEIVFRLRECLVRSEGEPNRQELENLIANELAAQPKNLSLRVKLLKLYLDTERVKEAYAHAVKVESRKPFPNSVEWYNCLIDIFEAYQEEIDQELNSDFYLYFLTAMDNLSALTLAEPHALCSDNDKKTSMHSCSIDNAASVIHTFDQLLKKVCDLPHTDGPWLYFLNHMKGQLYFRLATLLMKKALKDQGNWKEMCRSAAVLFLIGYSFKPVNLLQEVWFSKMDEKQKIFTGFFQQAALRTSFIGHIIMSLCKEDKSVWLQKLKQGVCIMQIQERTYNRLFNSIGQNQNDKDSYFLHDLKFVESSLEFPSVSALQDCDQIAYKICADSLHHLVWLHLHHEAKERNEFYKNYLFEIFKGLHYGNSNLSKGSPESLCLLDIESFLYATVYTSSLSLDHRNAIMGAHGEDTFFCVPPDIASSLCTSEQGVWWKATYDLFTGAIKEKLGEKRRILQRGLEIIRGIGNHGLDVQLVVYLARLLADRAASNVMGSELGKEDNVNKFHSERISQLENRSMHYWNIALGMLEKLEQGQTIRVPKEFLFASYNKNLTIDEITTLKEEGHLYLACREMNSGKLEEAASILSKLSSPFASFYLALTLKKSALQQIEVNPNNGVDAKSWNTRTALLNRAKDSLYTTMDRIKGDENHPLKKELMIEIEDIENEIVKDLESAHVNSPGICEEQEHDEIDNSPFSHQNSKCDSPKFSRRLMKQSTPRPSAEFLTPTSKYKNINETKNKRLQPSPERLDVQIRTLALTQDTLVKTVLEQQKALVETNKAVVEELKQNKAVVEDLKKQLEELRISTAKYFTRSSAKKSVALKGQGDDETEDDYGDYDANGCLLDYYIDDNGEMDYGRTAYPFVQPPVVPEPPVAPTISYIHQPPLQPSGPPPLTHYGYQYPPPPPLPPSGPVIAESSQYFHSTPAQGLSFSEGQRLPQFHFHVGSPMVKAPVPNTLGNVPTPLPPPSIIATPPGQQAIKQPVMQPNSPWVKGAAVAHAFQIPLPPSASAASTSTQPPTILSSPAPYITSNVDAQTPVTTSMVCSTVVPASTCGLLKTLLSTPSVVSLPGVSSVAHKNVSPSSNTSNTSREASFLNKSAVTPNPLRTRQNSDVAESVGSETESHDIEKEVMGDFKPLIPLPAEIIVETGEEGENVLFEERAKLFRYVDHEWKERGVGIMKLLHNEITGKVRVLMRRDQVLKVCANHFIVPSMEIHPMKNSDKAWIWAAQDFADETIKPEQFCVKFKTADIGILFKKAFVQAVAIVQLAEDKSVPAASTAITTLSLPFGGKFLPKTGSWTCPVCYVSNTSEKLFCAACETPKPLSQQTAAKSRFTVNTSSFPFAVSCNANIPIAVQPVATSSSETSIKIHDSYESDKKTVEAPTPAPTPASNLLSHSANKKTIMQLPIGTKATVGGFTFSSTPVIKESISPTVTDREILVVNTKSKNGSHVNKVTENTKSSPFSSFSFKPTLSTTFSFNSPASSNVIQTATENSDNKPNDEDANKQIVFDANSDVSQLQFTSTNDGISKFSKDSTFQGFSGAGSPLLITVTKDGRRVSGEFNCDGTPEEFEPTTEFKPVVPMPALVEVKTGEEEEEKLFGVRSKLYRYDRDGKEWKERGIGELKILFQKSTGKYRILMRREQVLKLCANHYILPKMKLTPLASSDRAWVWLAQDFSEGYLREEKFAAKFKNPDIAKQFHSVFENCKRNLPISTEEDSEENVIISKAAETSETDEQKSLSAHFKHKLGTWECSVCYAKNDTPKTSCVTCKSVKPVCKPTTKTASANANESSNNCNDLKKSFADLFKPDVDSWECKCCYVRNNKSVTVCIACESLKTGSNDIPAVPTSATPVSSNIFGFGPQTPATFNDSQNFVFGKSQASTSKPSFTFGSSTTPFTFGHPSLSQQSSDTFGFKPTLNSDNTNRSTAVFGGTTISPPKGITSSNSNFTVPPVTVPPAYVFGGTSSKFMFETSENNNCPSTPVDNSVEFRFGSPQKYEFNFCGVRPRSPSKTPKSPKTPGTPTDIEEEEEVESSDDIYFQPVIPLPPKVDVKTGEENETVLFGKRAKLFRFCSGEWKERGIGDIKILHNIQNETFRLLMRRDQVLKVCLNHYLSSDMKFEPKGDKALSWAATDFSENEPSPELFTVRFKTTEILSEFKNIADVIMRKLNSCDNKDGLKSSSTEILTSPVSVPGQELESFQKDSFTNKPNDDTRIKPDESSSTAVTSIPSHTVNAFNFSFKAEEKKQTSSPAFSLSSRFGGCTPVRELFGRPSDSSNVFSKSTFTFNKPKSSDKDIEVLELKTASQEKRDQAEKLKLPSNFFLYENKIPCPGCRGCDNRHVENCGMDDEMQVLYEAVASSEQIAAARDLMLPPTFFLYENKPPCPGCRGCTDEIPEHIGEKHVDDHDDDDKMSLKVEVSPPEVTEKEESVSQAMPFSTSESTFSFADITAKGSGFEALSKTAPNTILCSGAGAPVFRNLNDSKASEGGDDDAFSAPDIHFEPVIPLPELVEVKTGEEEETSVFSHRAKLYKYDSLSHQWKERGIGDFKILCHVEKCRYRLLLRREQVHKVACNHCITLDMKINRLSTSETTLCWNAIDYSDGHPECSQFAVKFKKKEIMEEFQSVFDKSMSILSLNQKNCGGDTVGTQIMPDSFASSAVSRSQCSDPIALQNKECQDEKNRTKVTGVGTAPTSQKNGKLPIVLSLESQSDVLLSSQNNQYLKDQTETSSVNPKDKNDVEKGQNELDELDENTDDDDDGEDNEELVFEKRVTFEVCDDETSNFKVAGLGLLRMLYDDSVFRYRITTTDDQDVVLCDHIIEFQTSLIKEKKTAIWAALDTSINPPKQRQFRATFSSIEAFTEFESLFNMGKQTALRAAIVENSNDSPSKC